VDTNCHLRLSAFTIVQISKDVGPSLRCGMNALPNVQPPPIKETQRERILQLV
jgi:hypothetical protein